MSVSLSQQSCSMYVLYNKAVPFREHCGYVSITFQAVMFLCSMYVHMYVVNTKATGFDCCLNYFCLLHFFCSISLVFLSHLMMSLNLLLFLQLTVCCSLVNSFCLSHFSFSISLVFLSFT